MPDYLSNETSTALNVIVWVLAYDIGLVDSGGARTTPSEFNSVKLNGSLLTGASQCFLIPSGARFWVSWVAAPANDRAAVTFRGLEAGGS